MSPELMTLLLFGALLLGLAIGIPISFALGGIAMVFAYFLWGHDALPMVAMSVSGVQNGFILVCVPMFLFMGIVLQESGIAEDLFEMFYHWMGPVRGGLAMGTVLICTIFAAFSGISSMATATMGIIALPSMLKRNYDKRIALGSIAAGAALGILIPPSIVMVFYGFMAQVSVGQLFMGGVIPGLVLSSLFIAYVGIRCSLQPNLGPTVPPEERVSWRKKLSLLRAVILPVLLILMVLGTIFLGLASPTEASAMGAFGSLLCAAAHRRLNWKLITKAGMGTLKLTAMGLWIALGAKAFAVTYAALGGQEVVRNLVASLEVNRWVILVGIQLSFFFLGMMLDPIGIIMLTVPVYVPLVSFLGFDPIWFGILFTVNMEMAYITPPFGWNLFFLKAVVPEGITLGDIYHSIVPFVALQATGLVLVMIFPQLALWLPSLMIKKI